MSAREVRLGVFALLGLASGCREVLGIETRTEGPPPLPLPEACMECVESACAGLERACAANPDCAALATCIAEAGLDNPIGRTACIDALPRGAATAAFVALDACSRSSCLDACYGPGGFFVKYGPACSACTEAACPQQMRDCVADASCEAGASHAYGNPDDLNPASIRPLILKPGEGGREEREFSLTCPAVCELECDFGGRDYGCVGNYAWPRVIPPSANVEIKVLLVDPTTQDPPPLPGALVEACTTLTPDCDPIATPAFAGNDGIAKLTIPLNGQLGFRGYLRVTGRAGDETVFPTHAMAYPVVGDFRADAYAVTRERLDAYLALFGRQRVQGSAHILGVAVDCRHRRAPDIEIELPAAAIDGASLDLINPTDRQGFFSLINVAPGCYDLIGRDAAEGETHRMRINAAPDALTVVGLTPTSDPPDIGYNCVPDFTQ